MNPALNQRRPLREVVSWNFDQSIEKIHWCRRPLREVVSWNALEMETYHIWICRPLREVVSWNIISHKAVTGDSVDLFVRSWVEISTSLPREKSKSSTSSWGRELKYFIYCFSEWAFQSTSSWGRELKCYWEWNGKPFQCVDLFVRSWVEISFPPNM